MARVALKMWIGNLDGRRSGCVIAPTKKRAIEIVGCTRSDFDNYWVLRPEIDPDLEPETLYTRKIAATPLARGPWFKGRVSL
jgi:hypothetical protein